MISTVKEICIFMIIAQAGLLLVPGNAYRKYVKALVGILMILMLTRPLLSLFLGTEGTLVLKKQLEELVKAAPVPMEIVPGGITAQQGEAGSEDMFDKRELSEEGENRMGIYSGIEEELKNRLNSDSGSEEQYMVERVELKRTGGVGADEAIEYVLLTVRQRDAANTEKIEIPLITIGEEKEKDTEGFAKEVEEALKIQYGNSIGVDPERIKVIKSHG